MMRPRILSLLVSLVAIAESINQSNAAAPFNFTARLDRFARCVMNVHGPQLAVPQLTVSVVGLNETWFTRGYGNRINQSTNQTAPIDEYTLFGIGSLTKAFTSAMIAQTIPLTNLYTPLNDPFTGLELKTYSDFLNVNGHLVDLLSHRTGIMRADLLWITQTPINQTQTVNWQTVVNDTFPRLPAHVTPRDAWLYNNYAFGQLGLYVEQKTGKSYEIALHDLLLQPLNMSWTVFGHRAARLKTDNIANLYSPSTLTTQYPILLPIELDDVIDAIAPAGAIQSNAVDMAEWMKAQLGNRPDVLSANLLTALHEVQMAEIGADLSNVYITAANPVIDQVYSGYGLGWMKYELNGRLTMLHTGSTLGQISLITLFPNENFGVFTSSPAITMVVHNYILMWVFYEVNYGTENNIFDKLCLSESGLSDLSDAEMMVVEQAIDRLTRLTNKSQGVTKHQSSVITQESLNRAVKKSGHPMIDTSMISDYPAENFVGLYVDSLWGTVNISLFTDERYPDATLLLSYGTLQMAMTPHSPPASNPVFDCQTLVDNPLLYLIPGSQSFAGFIVDPSGTPLVFAAALDWTEILFWPESQISSSTGMSSSSSSSSSVDPSSSSTGSDEVHEEGVSKATFIIVTAILSSVITLLLVAFVIVSRKLRNASSGAGESRSWSQLDMRSNLL